MNYEPGSKEDLFMECSKLLSASLQLLNSRDKRKTRITIINKCIHSHNRISVLLKSLVKSYLKGGI
jgi:hypothetical protein